MQLDRTHVLSKMPRFRVRLGLRATMTSSRKAYPRNPLYDDVKALLDESHRHYVEQDVLEVAAGSGVRVGGGQDHVAGMVQPGPEFGGQPLKNPG